MHLFLDIETLPADMDEAAKAALVADKVPANYKDPEKIAAWIAREADEVWRRTALDWELARVLCVGVAIDDEDPIVIYSETATPAVILDGLDAILGVLDRPTFIGHYVDTFDLPLLRMLAAEHDHPLIRLIPSEKWSPRVIDTAARAAGSNPKGIERPSLGKLCRKLGIAAKSDLDGSKVYDAWLAGEHDKIRRYCAEDVVAAREVFRRLPEVV